MTTSYASPGQVTPAPVILANKLMSAIPALAQYAGVAVTDVLSLEQWDACFTEGLVKHRMHDPSEARKEPLYVLILWLRMLATTHNSVTAEIALQAQKHLNMFGRWPLTVAFFITSSISASDPLLPPGHDLKPGEVPNGLRGDTYQAAKLFRDFLVESAKDATSLPMVPLYWQDNIALRIALSKVLHPGMSPAISPPQSYFPPAPRSNSRSPPLDLNLSALKLETQPATEQSNGRTTPVPSDRGSNTDMTTS